MPNARQHGSAPPIASSAPPLVDASSSGTNTFRGVAGSSWGCQRSTLRTPTRVSIDMMPRAKSEVGNAGYAQGIKSSCSYLQPDERSVPLPPRK